MLVECTRTVPFVPSTLSKEEGSGLGWGRTTGQAAANPRLSICPTGFIDKPAGLSADRIPQGPGEPVHLNRAVLGELLAVSSVPQQPWVGVGCV